MIFARANNNTLEGKGRKGSIIVVGQSREAPITTLITTAAKLVG